MSKTAEPPRLRPRFKGIENFLKRIAFNLGNSPSQTEVKIISCIPIDVTDLQNKIIELEKELDERANTKQEGRPASGYDTVVNTALVGAPRLKIPSSAAAEPQVTNEADHTPQTDNSEPIASPSHQQFHVVTDFIKATTLNNSNGCVIEKSNSDLQQKVKNMTKKKSRDRTQMIYYAQTANHSPFQEQQKLANVGNRQDANDVTVMDREYLVDVVQRQYQPVRLGADTSCTSRFSSPVCRDEQPITSQMVDTDTCSCCHGLFHNLDTARDAGFTVESPHAPPPVGCRDHSMYYDSSLYDVVPVKERPATYENNENVPDTTEERFNTHYDEFPKKFRTHPRYQPYIINYTTTAVPNRNNHRSLYRRKAPIKPLHKREQVLRCMQKFKPEKQTPKDESSQSCSVECGNVYTKTLRIKSLKQRAPMPPLPHIRPLPTYSKPRSVLCKNAGCLTTNLNDTECQTATSRSVQLEPPPPDENKTEITLNQIKTILHAVLTEVKTNSQMKATLDDKSVRDAVVQKGQSHSNIAARSSFINSYSFSPYNVSPVGQTCSTGNQLHPMGISTTPSHAAAATAFTPVRCLQNYPLFIHTTGRQCTCCFRNIPDPVRPPGGNTRAATNANMTHIAPHTAHTTNIATVQRAGTAMPRPSSAATHTATNTGGSREQRSKETETLIKEIYKSLAVNMEYPGKNTSNSDYPGVKSSDNTSQKIKFKFEPKGKAKVKTGTSGIRGSSEAHRTEVVRLTEVRGTSPTPQFGSRAFNVATSNAANSRSKLVSKTTTATSSTAPSLSANAAGVQAQTTRSNMERLRCLLASKELQSTGSEPDPSTSAAVTLPRVPPGYVLVKQDRVPVSYSDDDTDTLTSEDAESDVTVVDTKPEQKQKKGIFRKMVSMFTPRKRRRNGQSTDLDKPSSDSDDYETVYSSRSRRPQAVPYREAAPSRRRSRPHSKVSFARNHAPRRDAPRPRYRTPPYMEQEYRRQWNERVAYHGGDTPMPRYSPERGHSVRTPPQPPQPPHRSGPYWRGYEARAALVQQQTSTSNQNEAQTNTQMAKTPPVEDKVMYPNTKKSTKGLGWLKKRGLSIPCGDNWKRLILEG